MVDQSLGNLREKAYHYWISVIPHHSRPNNTKEEVVDEGRDPRVPRSQGPNTKVQGSHSNTSLTLKKVHLVVITILLNHFALSQLVALTVKISGTMLTVCQSEFDCWLDSLELVVVVVVVVVGWKIMRRELRRPEIWEAAAWS